MDQWKGKVAVVTGASSGIGASIAEELVKKGLKVVGLARRLERLNEMKEKLSNEAGEFHPIKCDIAVEEDILKAFDWIKNNLHGIDILVNNAGILNENETLCDGKTESWRKLFDTNVLGLCIATREAVKSMTERNVPGYIIHINSVVGHMIPTKMSLSVYPASKFAVTALTETLRIELAGKKAQIKVSSISPGAVLTEIMGPRDVALKMAEQFNVHPMEPIDIANAVLYLLSTPPTVHVSELTIRSMNEVF